MINKRKLFYSLGPNSRLMARRLYYLPGDIIDRLSGKRDPLTPPKGLIFTGSGNFEKIGKDVVRYCIEHGGLQPNHAVLDIGSGMGRIAAPMTKYLSPELGKYEGFDVMEQGVKWCTKKITKRFPNFNFTYTPLENDLYRSSGNSAENFKFPYPDESFDFTISNSVYTHMLPTEVDNYLKECNRILKPGGRCYATFFILNEESKKLMKSVPDFSFPHVREGYSLMDDVVTRANVAFEKDYLVSTIVEPNGLKLKEMYPGFWPGRPKEKCLEFQDILILEKKG